MRINLQKYSFRFAEQVLNSKIALIQEIEDILLDPDIEFHTLNRPHFNKVLENLFKKKVNIFTICRKKNLNTSKISK